MSFLPLSLEYLNTPTGRILIVTDDQDTLRAVDWEDHESRMHRLLRRHYREYTLCERAQLGHSAPFHALGAYFDGEFTSCENVKVETNGTEFQQAVWRALRSIPAGQTVTYGALATRIGHPTAARAVGLANGSNPIPIVVPCHRVIGSDSSLTGFGGGLERKRWLLRHEKTEQFSEQLGQLLNTV